MSVKINFVLTFITTHNLLFLLELPQTWDRGLTREEFEGWFRDNAEYHEPSYVNPDRTAEDLFQVANWYYTPWPYPDDMEANRKAASDVSFLMQVYIKDS